jgi:hypothetical protein
MPQPDLYGCALLLVGVFWRVLLCGCCTSPQQPVSHLVPTSAAAGACQLAAAAVDACGAHLASHIGAPR